MPKPTQTQATQLIPHPVRIIGNKMNLNYNKFMIIFKDIPLGPRA